MTPNERSRLERIETFISRLTLGSYLAKAVDEGRRVGDQQLSDADAGLAAAVAAQTTSSALGRRVEHLEQQQRGTAQAVKIALEHGSHASSGSPVASGETALATLAGGLRSADAILAAAARNPAITPEMMGIVTEHLARHDLPAARRVVLEASERQSVAKAADLTTGAMTAVQKPDPAEDVAAVTEAVGRLERELASMGSRLSILEARQTGAATATPSWTVAKAAPARRTTVDALNAMIDAYIDSPSQAGVVSSLIQAGRLDDAEKMLLSAKNSHEAMRATEERRSWQH